VAKSPCMERKAWRADEARIGPRRNGFPECSLDENRSTQTLGLAASSSQQQPAADDSWTGTAHLIRRSDRRTRTILKPCTWVPHPAKSQPASKKSSTAAPQHRSVAPFRRCAVVIRSPQVISCVQYLYPWSGLIWDFRRNLIIQ
jgi:hypothetical protein